jgi:DNA-binding MarR family transcriptional regulator
VTELLEPAVEAESPEPSAVRTTYLVKQLERAVRREIDRGLRGFGLSALQYTALSVLERHPGMSGAQLSRRSFVSPQAGNQMIATLERKGLICRQPTAENRRVLGVFLAEDGRALLRACDAVVSGVEARMIAALSSEDVARLRDVLRACLGAVERGA